jgi:hypothetical protein
MQNAGSKFLRNIALPPNLHGFTTEETGLFSFLQVISCFWGGNMIAVTGRKNQ